MLEADGSLLGLDRRFGQLAIMAERRDSWRRRVRASKHRPEFGLMLSDAESHDATTFRDSAGCRFLQYIARVAFEAVLQEVLEMPAEKRAELVERVIDSLDDDEVELSADELAQLDDAAMDADRAAERGELLPQDEVLVYMRQIS